jgi:very-short-patch-repair endonuclease
MRARAATRLLIHRAALPAREVRSRDAIPVTSPARTVVDVAGRSPKREVERMVDQALTDRRCTEAELRAVADRSPRLPGASALRRLLDAAESLETLTRSELEEAFLSLIRSAGLPTPALNLRVQRMRVDAAWRTERVAVELDGYEWHRTRRRHDADRGRDAALRRLGWLPVRYSFRQVIDEPVAVIADLAPILTRRRHA